MSGKRPKPGGSAVDAVGRHRARRNAMMVLYRLDVVPGDLDGVLAEFPELPAYARALVDDVLASTQGLDSTLQEHLEEWTLDRLGAVERSILRIAACELGRGDVPREVVIDEAVELAKRYASPEAARLVNGVLGGVVGGES